MADEENTTEIDTDNMSMEEIRDLSGKMRDGEAVAAPEVPPEPDPEPAPPSPDDEEAALAAAEAEPVEEAQKGSKMVPHKTFNYANERRKAAEKEAADARERYARLEERTKLLLEAQAPAPQPQNQPATEQEPIPDPDQDPLGAVKWLKKQIEADNAAKIEQQATQQRQTEEQQAFRQAFEEVNTAYQAAITADPTVVDAHKALRRSIGNELLMFGYTEQQALAELEKIENQHLLYIQQNRLDVGDYLKRLAGTRGWAPSAAPAPAPDLAPASGGKDKLEQARQAAASLGTSGGAVANSGKITPEMLADMPEADFQEYMKKHGSTRPAFAA